MQEGSVTLIGNGRLPPSSAADSQAAGSLHISALGSLGAATMFQKPKVPDRQILQKVTAQLPRRGIRPPCDVRVSVHDGTVTLTGKLEFDLQRKAAVACGTPPSTVCSGSSTRWPS